MRPAAAAILPPAIRVTPKARRCRYSIGLIRRCRPGRGGVSHHLRKRFAAVLSLYAFIGMPPVGCGVGYPITYQYDITLIAGTSISCALASHWPETARDVCPANGRRLFHSAAGTSARARPRMAGTRNAARAAAIDSPSATTNAREYPALSAAVTDVAPWLAASAACARSVAIVASTARPREPPICREVLRTPEASPASVKATPAVAAAASGVNSKPRASAMRQPRPNTCVQYELSGLIADSHANPQAATTVPVSSSGRTPVRGMIRELVWAPMMIVTAPATSSRDLGWPSSRCPRDSVSQASAA